MNKIGLDNKKSEQVAKELNKLLASYSCFYQNTRAGHWNVKGSAFFELHAAFENLYNDIAEKIDAIAERILTLGFTPEHKFSVYKTLSEIKESKTTSDSKTLIREILDSFSILLNHQRKILDLTAELNDEGTNALMSDYIGDYEKQVWMFSSCLSE